MSKDQAGAIEEERQQLLRQLSEDAEAGWLEQFKPGSAGCHELLDRTNLLADLLEQHVLSHPACVQNIEWFRFASEALEKLRDLYQRIGEKHLDAPDTAAKKAAGAKRQPVQS